MRCWSISSLLAFALTLGAAVAAQTAKPGDYHFAPGDVIEVTVSPQRSFDRTITVQPDGKVSYPIVGQIQVAGLTVSQLAEKLRSELNHDLVDPVVSVSLREAGKREVGRVSLLGAVRNVGGVDIKAGSTLAEALAGAGGATPLADLHRVTITHPDGSVNTVDLSQSEKTGRLDRNVTLQPGDIVVVPEGVRPSVLVLGELVKPGSYEIQAGARLLDAIQSAGGLTLEADLRRVTLARSGAAGSQVLDLEPLLKQGETKTTDLNVLLTAGDTIFVPKTEQQIYVLGSVTKPGVYPIKPTDRVVDILVQASPVQGSSKVVLVRKGNDGQPVATSIDLKQMLEHGDATHNELLRPGDMLYVPEKKARRSTSENLGLLYPLLYLFRL